MKKNDELAAAFLAGDNSSVEVEALPIGQLLMRSFFSPLELSRFLNKELERVNQRVWEDKKKPTCLQEDSCLQHTVGFIMQEPRLPARSMLCQSVLRHLRHIGSVMKSVEKRGI